MFLAACDVAFTVSGSGVTCGGTLSQVDTSSFLPVFDLSTLDPSVIASAFAGGFGIAMMAYVTGKGFSLLLSFIRSIR